MAPISLLSDLTSVFSRRHRTAAAPLRSFPYDDVAAATSHFHPSTLLGRGSHASVFRASLDGGRLLAAAKVVTTPPSAHSSAHISSANEIDILSSVRSPLVVNLLGVTAPTSSSARIAVVEFMPNGSLYDHLHRRSNRPPLSWPRRLRLALQVGEAVLALHSLEPPVIHRDIKSANVLLDDRGNARLADFGLAVRGGGTPLPAGTFGYLDPGYVDPAGLSTKSDVFSFGILLLEIISGRKAIDMDHSPPALLDWAVPLVVGRTLEGLCDSRIAQPEGHVRRAVTEVASMARRCVADVAAKRPDMAEVVRRLRTAERMMLTHTRLWGTLCRWSRIRGRRVSDVGELTRG